MRRCPLVSKRKRKEAPSYERQRNWNKHFKDCSRLSSCLYRQMPRDKRRAGLQQKGTGLAIRLTKEGKDQYAIELALMKLMGLKHINKLQEVDCMQVIEGKEVNIQGKRYVLQAAPDGKGGWIYSKKHNGGSYRKRLMDEEAMEKTMRGEDSLVEDYQIPLTPSLVQSQSDTPQGLPPINPIIQEKLFVPTQWPPYTLPPLPLQEQINNLLHRKTSLPEVREEETANIL